MKIIFEKSNAEKLRGENAYKNEQERISLLEQHQPYDFWNKLSEKYDEEFITDFKNDLENKKNLHKEFYFQNYFN